VVAPVSIGGGLEAACLVRETRGVQAAYRCRDGRCFTLHAACATLWDLERAL
jgi:hypothetical protein